MGVVIVHRKWWAFELRGALFALFGLVVWVRPGIDFRSLLLLFGAMSLVDGLLTVTSALRCEEPGDEPWWLLSLEGLAGVIVGIAAIVLADVPMPTLVHLLGLRAIAAGAFEAAAAVRLRALVRGEWLLASSGAVSLIFGALTLGSPGFITVGLQHWMGAYALVIGGLVAGLGVELHKVERRRQRPVSGRLVASP